VIGIAAGRCRAISAGLTDLIFQRIIETLGRDPSLYIIIIVAAIWPMNFWLLVG
jgi:microcin C transport system permease protein